MQDIEIFIGANPGDYQRVLKELESDRKRLAETEKRIAKESAEAVERIRRDYAEREKKMAQEVAGIRIAEEKRTEAAILREQQRATAQREREEKASLERRRQAMQELGQMATVTFAGLALVLGASVKEFADFESSLNQIKAVSGATAEQMDRLKLAAQKLGADTKFSAKEAADGMGELAKAGFTVEQTLAAIPGVMSLAAAGGVSVAQAAEAAAAALNGFGLGADEAQRVADLLAKTANVSAVGIGDLQNSMKYIAPIAASTSQSIEEVATVLAVLGNAGIKGEQGGTVVRASLVALAKPSDDAADKLHALGISIQDTHGKMLPFSDIIGQLRDKTSGLTEVQRANAVATIFGSEAMSGILALMKQTPAQFDAAAKSVRDYNGASKEMADTMNGGIKGAFEQLGGSVSTLAIQIGEQLAPAVKLVADSMQGLTDLLGSQPKEIQALVGGIGSASLAFAGLLAIVGSVGAALPLLEAGFVALGGTMAATLPILTGIAVAIGAVVVAIKAYSEASESERREAEKARKERIEGVRSANEHKRALEALVAEHDALASKTKLTKEEQARMKALQGELQKQYPGLAEAVKKTGDQHWGNVEAIKNEIVEYERLTQVRLRGAQQALKAKSTEYQVEYDKLAALQKQLEEFKAANSGLAGPGERQAIAGMAAAMQAEIKAQSALVIAKAKTQASAAAELTTYEQILAPVVATPTPARGGIVPGADRKGRKGKDPAKEAEDAARDRISRIQTLNERQADLAKAGGLNDTAAALSKLGGVINDIRAEKLDKTAAGLAAIEEATHRIQVLLKEQRGQIDKLEQQSRAEMEANLESFGKHAEEVQEQIGKDAVKANEDFAASVRDIGGEVAALAIDPSLERIANFAQGLVSDPEKIKKYGQVIQELGDAFQGADDASSGLDRAVSKLASALDPITLAIAAAVDTIRNLESAIRGASEASQEFADLRGKLAIDAAEAEAEASGDPQKKLDVKLAQIARDREAEIKRMTDLQNQADITQRDDFTKGLSGLSNMGGPLGLVLGFGATALGIRNQAGLLKGTLAGGVLDWINKKYAGQETTARNESQSGNKKSAEENAKSIEEAITKQQEMMEGALDEAGNKISLEARKQLDLDKLREQHAQTMYQLEKQKTDLVRQQSDLESETAKRIKDIENEGIAVRALTEFQDKAVRIAAVQEEADKKKSALKEQLEGPYGINKQIEAEERQYLNQQQYIKNTADARIQALASERSALMTNLGIDLQRLEAMRQMAAMNGGGSAGAKAAASLVSGQTGGRIDGSKVTVGTVAPNMADGGKTMVRWDGTSWNRAATGGMVGGGIPGVDSVPILAQQGELIVDNATTAALQGFLRNAQEGGAYPPIPAAAMQLPAGGGVTNVNVVINGGFDLYQPGERQRLAQLIARDVDMAQGARTSRRML